MIYQIFPPAFLLRTTYSKKVIIMNSRERVMNSLNFKQVDRLPKDLGGMASTGISCFAYRKLIDYLGLKERKIKVWDCGQMLALPDLDVLDILGCDVVMTDGYITNAFEQDELWKPYDFNGRLKNGAVLYPEDFSILENGTIIQNNKEWGLSSMPASAFVFDEEHAGQPFNLDDDFIFEDLDAMEKELKEFEVSDEEVMRIAAHCKRVRESTDRAVMFNGLNSWLGFQGGIVQGSMLCMMEPEYVERLNRIKTGFAKKKYEKILPAIAPYIDIVMVTAEDMGTQNSLILPPDVCKSLYFDVYHELNDLIHNCAPHVKTFIHSCGAIYDIIDLIADSGFDILNPVQWSAGGHTYQEWKNKARNKIALWGGAVDAQHVLPLETAFDVKAQAKEVAAYFAQDTGVMFNNCHNILAEIEPEKILALYSAADEIKP